MKTDQKMLYIDINGIYENHKEHISILCGKTIEFLYVTAGGTYTYRRAIFGERHWCVLHPGLTLKMSWALSSKACSPTAYVTLVRRRNTEIKQRIRKK